MKNFFENSNIENSSNIHFVSKKGKKGEIRSGTKLSN